MGHNGVPISLSAENNSLPPERDYPRVPTRRFAASLRGYESRHGLSFNPLVFTCFLHVDTGAPACMSRKRLNGRRVRGGNGIYVPAKVGKCSLTSQ